MKNIDVILQAMMDTALESRKYPKKAQGNQTVIDQLYMTVEGAVRTQHAQRHNKNTINQILDRTFVGKKTLEQKASEAGSILGKRSHRKVRVADK